MADAVLVEAREPSPVQQEAQPLKVTLAATQVESAAAFPYFPYLPAELRFMVWGFATDGLDQRIFHAAPSWNGILRFWNHPQPPAVLHACQESRHISKNRLSFIITNHEGHGTWWNPELDILYMDVAFGCHRKELKDRSSVMQHVAIDWHVCHTTVTVQRSMMGDDDFVFANLMIQILRDCPNMKSLAIFVPEKQPPNLSLLSKNINVYTVPIKGITDITNSTTKRMAHDKALQRLASCTAKLECPSFRQRWSDRLCRGESERFKKMFTNDRLSIEARLFILHRSWPPNEAVDCTKLNEQLPSLDKADDQTRRHTRSSYKKALENCRSK